ncbi:MAG TPA: mechanosensitive ion channel domain-containing protein [Chryseolinea sp.]|nr:mechanosensitive ion channel domain-containing protein [Chryseolinea sp.]
MEYITKYSDQFATWIMTYGTKLLGAIIVFIVGLYVTNWLSRAISRGMSRRHFDVSLQSFLSSMIGVGLKVLLLITVAGMLGIQTTSFVAIIGAMGLAVGLALQGSLANFAGGVLMLVFKPFKVGDLIESQGQTGVVQEIQIFNTILLTADLKTIILANGAVSNGTIINYSKHGNLRVDIGLAVSPENDFQKVKKVVEEVMASHSKVLKDPKPTVTIQKMGDGMVSLSIRPFALQADYWDVYYELQENLKTAFEKNDISAPIPKQIQITK